MSIFCNRSISFILISIAMTAMAAIPAQASSDTAAEAPVLASTCLGCHGIPGYRNAYPSYRVPKLGGQHPEYIVIALHDYKNKGRAHKTMQAQAAGLSEQDMQALAAYLSGRGKLATGKAKSDARIERGREKAAVCTACHGANGVSTMPNWPVLAGQHESYLKQALTGYKQGSRTDPVMAGQVLNLTEEDIADLAAFFAAQPGVVSIK